MNNFVNKLRTIFDCDVVELKLQFQVKLSQKDLCSINKLCEEHSYKCISMQKHTHYGTGTALYISKIHKM